MLAKIELQTFIGPTDRKFLHANHQLMATVWSAWTYLGSLRILSASTDGHFLMNTKTWPSISLIVLDPKKHIVKNLADFTRRFISNIDLKSKVSCFGGKPSQVILVTSHALQVPLEGLDMW